MGNTRLKNEISDLGIVMESTTRELQEEKVNNDIKNCKIEELNEKVCMIAEEKMKMKSENDKSIENLKLCKKVAEDKFLSRQEVAKETIWKLEEAMSLQKQQHLYSIETSRQLLESMEVKLCVREKELNDIIGNEMKMKDQMKLTSMRGKESNEMIRHRDMKIEEHLEALNSSKSEITRLKNEISDLRIVVESATVGLQEEKVKNNTKDCKIEELNEKVCRITEDVMKMKNENDKGIEEMELCKKMAEDEFSSHKEVANETIRKLEEAMSLQKQQHLSSSETSDKPLKSMEVKLCVREKDLNNIKEKEVEMKDQMKLTSIRGKESNEMIRHRDWKIEEQLDVVKSMKLENARLKN